MAKQYGSQRKRGGASPLLVTLGILVVGLVGGALLLHATGVVELSFLKKEEPPKAVDRTGQVWVPMASRSIPAYTEITSSHLIDPRTNQPTGYWFTKQQIEQMGGEMLQKVQQITGRVLRKEKPAGYVFTDKEFFAPGTRPGPTAGVPPGKRALRLKASDVPGLHGLKQGDRFDLVMTVSVEVEEEPLRGGRRKSGALEIDGPYADLHESQQQPEAEGRVRIKRQHAEVRTIVNNGTVVQPVMQRNEIGMASSLLRGTKVTQTPIEEIIIAIAPEEVADLNFAMAVDAKLQVAMRSGQTGGDDVDEGRIPDIAVVIDEQEGECSDGEGGRCTTRVVEVIKGGEKTLLAVPQDKVPANNSQE